MVQETSDDHNDQWTNDISASSETLDNVSCIAACLSDNLCQFAYHSPLDDECILIEVKLVVSNYWIIHSTQLFEILITPFELFVCARLFINMMMCAASRKETRMSTE